MDSERFSSPESLSAKGLLQMTAEDHRAIGSTPPYQIMIDNPTKTLGELWDETQIKNYLERQLESLPELISLKPEVADNLRPRLKADFEYLKSIGKLPREFEHYEDNLLTHEAA
jgi:hypothetical protein